MSGSLDEAVTHLKAAETAGLWGEVRIQFRRGEPVMVKTITTHPINANGRTEHGKGNGTKDFPDPD